MVSKIVLALLAASSAVIAAPARKEGEKAATVDKEMNVDVSKTYNAYNAPEHHGKESYDRYNYGAGKHSHGYAYEETDEYMGGAEKYDQGYRYEEKDESMDDAVKYGLGYAYDGMDEAIYAKEILCPAYYKIIYMTVPVKCDCKAETRYEKPEDFDIENVDFEKDYKVYHGNSRY
ncbi:hypothetical protein SeMB42_g02833 [Synchytrium endobioticum]|uniref:Uncharacterized protein n=1 Tax=Synchytrium endobioticum TaxID=286115 RepID=A0A507DBR0_9FUNG|nr:hypothetical protein SeMB42_g07381 [Synchytrium endobioticum]TPX34968.1 hypothetical protein SeLEV6574_g08233 [Synchytrium endobioticum]TPX42716.1 hypothetical protein SeMB42_g05019 [Synchytrium endobioticum]TPX48821.1 hypothetical protein SeMB42_g02833 [Synchytrium endobioticum]